MMTCTLFVALTLGQPLTDNSLPKLRDAIMPAREELRWRDIAWQPTLWDALLAAQRDEKPVLLYAMNGNPLGCV